MSLLEDIVSGDGLSSLHGIIWIGLGVWALIGTFFYIPAINLLVNNDYSSNSWKREKFS